MSIPLTLQVVFQKSVALSAGEAELAARVAGVAEGSGLQRSCAEVSLTTLGSALSVRLTCRMGNSASRGCGDA